MEKFKFKIISPLETAVDREINQLMVQTLVGSLGVRKNHMPMVAVLQSGNIEYQVDEECWQLQISGGILCVTLEQVTLLIDEVLEVAKQAN